MKARASTISLLAGATCALSIGGMELAAAQLRAPADIALIDPLPAHHADGATPYSSTRSSIELLPAPMHAPATGWGSLASRISLIGLPAHGATIRPARSHFAIGFASETMRGWLADMGLDPGSCTAPIIRLRSRVDTSSDFRGALWVHARCSLR